MQFDIFFSICQTPVDGYKPSERQMFLNFFDQVRLADQLGFGCGWIAETHLSCQIQKRNPGAVIPKFEGEIGLNTDFLQIATRVFAQTKRLNIGSAIRNILCNGGPIAHAENIRMFLALHGLDLDEKRKIEVGFASGRFPFSNFPYGIKPRNEVERLAWPVLRGLIFKEATEIFLRFIKGEIFNHRSVATKQLRPELFRSSQDWEAVVAAWQKQEKRSDTPAAIDIPPTWVFDDVGVIPFEVRRDLLRLTIGSHDRPSHEFANTIYPCGVFNLSITPNEQIEKTHTYMQKVYHPEGGPWHRGLMPRTVLVFLGKNAEQKAERAISNYWQAMEGTLDPLKVSQAVGNALVGEPEAVAEQMRARFDKDDRLMLWFDYNNHDNEDVKQSMRLFLEKVAPQFA